MSKNTIVRVVLFTTLLLGLSTAFTGRASAEENIWTGIGPTIPYSGYISALAVDPVTPGTLYAARGEVYKSIDGGASWLAAGSGLPADPSGVFSLAIDPTLPSTVYAGTAGGVYKSMAGGASWLAANNGLGITDGYGYIYAMAIDPFAPNILYVGLGDVVYKSADGGENWQQVSVDLPVSAYVYSLVIDPKMPATLYAGTYGSVYKSIDSGAHWT
ncbi:MAG: hypothetical protein EHM21_01930, partial [Chloroflexi bacterium]